MDPTTTRMTMDPLTTTTDADPTPTPVASRNVLRSRVEGACWSIAAVAVGGDKIANEWQEWHASIIVVRPESKLSTIVLLSFIVLLMGGFSPSHIAVGDH
eukprot:scaffold1301_cov128-Cylindrotheca_fusiformis.AAC.3